MVGEWTVRLADELGTPIGLWMEPHTLDGPAASREQHDDGQPLRANGGGGTVAVVGADDVEVGEGDRGLQEEEDNHNCPSGSKMCHASRSAPSTVRPRRRH
ncbi:hypothetical protein ZWY2020_051681 [Hordeum vulgare]|nr:hypothetical protein ZWY2020_051681 [Hordeum vulgare]